MIRSRNVCYVPPRDLTLKPSQTVPDQSLTIRQLVTRFVRGLPPAEIVRSDMQYDEECTVDSKGYFHGNGDWEENPANRKDQDLSDISNAYEEIREITKEETKKYRQRRAKNADE